MSEEAKNRILLRRAKFVAAAIAASAISSADACGGTTAPSDGGADSSMTDAGPQVCLKMAVDSGPQPCLAPIQDSGTDSGSDQ
jgi:hypothetical protein